jgi:hypothetical protein
MHTGPEERRFKKKEESGNQDEGSNEIGTFPGL